MAEKLSIKNKQNTEVKKMHANCLGRLRQGNRIMALKDITTQNPESAPKNLKLVNKRLIKG